MAEGSKMYALLVVAVLLGLAAPPGLAADNPRDRLEWLIGTWTIEGREDSFTEVCEWFPNRSHVVCNGESRGKNGIARGVSVLSYSDPKQRYLYYHDRSSGIAMAMDFFTDGKSLTAIAERAERGEIVREQVWMTPQPDGSFEFREDVSTNGGPWQTRTRFRYVRKGEKP